MFKPSHIISMTRQKRKNAGSPARIMQESTLNAIIQNTDYTITLEVEDDGDHLYDLPIPKDLLNKLKWTTGDVIQCHVELDNTMTLRKLHV